MKISTRSRYGTRLMLDMAQHYNEGPIQLGDITKRQDLSVKYLEQIIIPLKKTPYVKSVRGPKGGYVLARPPEEITVGEIVDLLGKTASTWWSARRGRTSCRRAENCITRHIWREAGHAMFAKLNSITLADLVKISKVEPPAEG